MPARLTLVCIPYAGGHAGAFRHWNATLGTAINCLSVCFPGRGPRLREAFCDSLSNIVDDVEREVRRACRGPLALFGHSMGAMVALELARRWRDGESPPVHLILSGVAYPEPGKVPRRISDLPDDEFIEELRRINGTRNEILCEPELMEMMVPVLRSDLRLCEEYEFPEFPCLDCPVTVFGGARDPEVDPDKLRLWKTASTSTYFKRVIFPGDHFFVHSEADLVIEAILSDLRKHLSDSGCACPCPLPHE